MILRVPDYYEEFVCIADRCKDSCCIGWEIDIDEETRDYYLNQEGSFREKVEKYMVDAALECGATIVQKCFHVFNPYGVSGVVIISESHLAIHTWPELGYAAVDLFTCGDKCDPKVSYEFLRKKFNSKKATFTELKRGIINEETMKVMEKPFEIMQQSIQVY